jgi:hypothetical protein
MTEDVPHLEQACTRFNQIGRRIVPQVVLREISDACQFPECAETAAQVFVRLSDLVIEEQVFPTFLPSSGDELGNSFVGNFNQRNPIDTT